MKQTKQQIIDEQKKEIEALSGAVNSYKVKTIKFKNSIRGRCFEYEDKEMSDTAGNPTKVRVCFCGTTACQVLGEIKGYPLPADFKKVEKEVKIK